jgi:hypothetical protein
MMTMIVTDRTLQLFGERRSWMPNVERIGNPVVVAIGLALQQLEDRILQGRGHPGCFPEVQADAARTGPANDVLDRGTAADHALRPS